MPISQSDCARHSADAPRPSRSVPSRILAKPLRMASVVIDCNQSRFTHCFAFVYLVISRKISSPSRAASQAFTRNLTSGLVINSLMSSIRCLCSGTGFNRNTEGMMGRVERLQRLKVGSISSGSSSEKR